MTTGTEKRQLSVVQGPAIRLLAASKKKSPIGGEPPEWVTVLPYPEWELYDKTHVTDDECQKLCVAAFEERGLELLFDYEHESELGEPGKQFDAAGWAPSLVAGGRKGLLAGPMAWTDRAAEKIRSGEIRYISPTFLVDVLTNRVIAIISVALTNIPRSNKLTPLTEQKAASLIASYYNEPCVEGNSMGEWIRYLINFFCLPYSTTPEELKNELMKLVNALDEPLKAAASMPVVEGEQPATLAEACGFIARAAAAANDAAGDGAVVPPAEPVTAAVPKELLETLGLPETASTTEVCVAALKLKHRDDVVPKAEHEKIVTELAAMREAAQKARVEELASQAPPALREEVRRVASISFETAEKWVASMTPLPEPVTEESDPKVDPDLASLAPAAEKIKVNGTELDVDPEKASLVKAVAAIQEELRKEGKKHDYASAYEVYRKRQAAA